MGAGCLRTHALLFTTESGSANQGWQIQPFLQSLGDAGGSGSTYVPTSIAYYLPMRQCSTLPGGGYMALLRGGNLA